ncbi:MAG: hypothetical protein HOO96_29495 [Polyangiaceae bacterium]|nr:hypothetical protein [Polyangiaceae bacterium]
MTPPETCALCAAAITAENPTHYHVEFFEVQEAICDGCIGLPHERFVALVGAYQARLFGDPSAHAGPGGDA